MEVLETLTCVFICAIGGLPVITGLTSYSKCGSVVDMGSQAIYTGAIAFSFDAKNDNPFSCDVTIRARKDERLMFYFRKFQLGRAYYGRVYFKMEVRDLVQGKSSPVTGLPLSLDWDSGLIEGVYTTAGRELQARLYTNKSRYHNFANVTIIFTSFHNGTCEEDEFRCDTARCISSSIVCNGNNPCGDGSDCATESHGLSIDSERSIVIMAGVFGGGIFVIMATVCLRQARTNTSFPSDATYCQDTWSSNSRRVSDGSVLELSRARQRENAPSYADLAQETLITNNTGPNIHQQDTALLQIHETSNRDSYGARTPDESLNSTVDNNIVSNGTTLSCQQAAEVIDLQDLFQSDNFQLETRDLTYNLQDDCIESPSSAHSQEMVSFSAIPVTNNTFTPHSVPNTLSSSNTSSYDLHGPDLDPGEGQMSRSSDNLPLPPPPSYDTVMTSQVLFHVSSTNLVENDLDLQQSMETAMIHVS